MTEVTGSRLPEVVLGLLLHCSPINFPSWKDVLGTTLPLKVSPLVSSIVLSEDCVPWFFQDPYKVNGTILQGKLVTFFSKKEEIGSSVLIHGVMLTQMLTPKIFGHRAARIACFSSVRTGPESPTLSICLVPRGLALVCTGVGCRQAAGLGGLWVATEQRAAFSLVEQRA